MKNLLNQKPNLKLNARLSFSAKFVANKDIKDKKVLDIGCGFGWFELNALKRGVKQIVGIDMTRSDLKAARQIKDSRIMLKTGSALKLPFTDNSFETVVAWEVIEHLPKNSEVLMFKEVNRVLKKNGSFYLSTPYDSFISKMLDPAFWLMGHRHYNKKQLMYYGESNNLIIKKICPRGKFWDLISILNMYISKWIFKRKAFFEQKIEKKVSKEYFKTSDGFVDLFVKYEKK